MCGILGQINFSGKPIDKVKLKEARDLLTHRGPDDAGLYLSKNNNIGLAHRRLSIIDLTNAAHQPMTTVDGRYTIVFNGEIYNYKELISTLRSPFSSLHSNSDTEVLLNLYAQEGCDCLKRLRGMYAFAIWDEKEKKLFAARDSFGIKPLFYLLDKYTFIFSSELKAIRYIKKDLTVSTEAVDAYLKTGSVPAPLTIYNEARSLLPGHFLEINLAGEISIRRYWHFYDLLLKGDNGNGKRKRYNQEAKHLIKSALQDTVRARNVADVEVGAFLSGGIDSTAIVSLMRSIGKEEITTVSVSFPGNRLDESVYSKLAAETFETHHLDIHFYEKDLLEELDSVLGIMDQPTIDGLNTYFVSKAAKRAGLKAIMSGIGGDELFGGYPSFVKIPFYRKIKSIPLAKTVMSISIPALYTMLPEKAKEYFKNPAALNAEYRLVRGLFTENELSQMGWTHSNTHPFDNGDGYDSNSDGNYFNTMQYISFMESTRYMANQLLMDSDIFSMAHSLELRVPYVDENLYAAVLPYLDYNDLRRNFKRLLVDNVVGIPPQISGREKMGFTFPFEEWMRKGELRKRINDILDSKRLDAVFNKKRIDDNIKKFSEGRLHWSRIWALAVLEKFI